MKNKYISPRFSIEEISIEESFAAGSSVVYMNDSNQETLMEEWQKESFSKEIEW